MPELTFLTARSHNLLTNSIFQAYSSVKDVSIYAVMTNKLKSNQPKYLLIL